MPPSPVSLLEEIIRLPAGWHGAGSVSPHVLHRIAEFADQLGPLHHTLESGSGRTTLLFSHLSSNHLVFALEGGGSISQVKASPLFHASHVTFVEGPTQLTLPNFRFTNKVQLALIDGPHGYPFPDLEYYYFYPLIVAGGLLLLDDIKIPSVRRMFDIIRADDMFDLLEIIDRNTAVFRRSNAPLIDPQSDSWWLQGCNRAYYDKIQARSRAQKRLQSLARITPNFVKRMIPARLKRML